MKFLKFKLPQFWIYH